MVQKLKQDLQIGSMIRQLRYEKGYTQEQVVAKLQLKGIDITRSIYSQIESGSYSIRISVLAALTEIFQTDYNTIFSDIKGPSEV